MFSLNMLKNKFLIVYGLNEEEIERLNLRFNNMCNKEPYVIKGDMGLYTLANIIGEEVVDVKSKELPKEKVIFLNGFQGVFLNQAVKKIRETLGSTPILASTTPNSVRMSLEELFNHLVAEREFYKKK